MSDDKTKPDGVDDPDEPLKNDIKAHGTRVHFPPTEQPTEEPAEPQDRRDVTPDR